MTENPTPSQDPDYTEPVVPDEAAPDEAEEVVEEDDGETTPVDLYDANQGKVKRTGGPYLDEIEKQKAEEWRAKVEDREPDLDNPPAVAGTQLVTKDKLTVTDTAHTHDFSQLEVKNEPVDTIQADTHSKLDEPAADPSFEWDNDGQKLAAAEQAARYEELKSKVS
jgi:hypothetical protein